jgi:alpha-1,3-rhamnosyl/mannosyltransferase
MSAPLRVGLNLFYMNPSAGGAGTYARELVPALLRAEPETRVVAFISRDMPEDMLAAPWAGEVEWVRFPFGVTSGRPGTIVTSSAAQWGATPIIAARRRLDVVHGLANIVPLLQPRAATVATLLDVIWMHFPKSLDRRATLAMKLSALPSARRADRVITISEAAKRDIVATVGLDPALIDVTYLGIRLDDVVAPAPEAELRERLGLGSARVVLCVAQKREHKNLANLIRAVAALDDDDVKLVLVGSPTPHEAELRRLAVDLGIEDRLALPEWLSDADLEGLYALAACFVLPSLMEGFGLPILEAMRRDVPVACSNVSSLPEVAGDAAELFDPHDPQAIRAAIARILGDPEHAARLVQRGRQRCRQFTWDATARATLDSYRRAIAERRLPRLSRAEARR